MADFVVDSFTEAGSGTTTLASHTGETGATWTIKTAGITHGVDRATDRAWSIQASESIYYASGLPATADYTVQSDFFPRSMTGTLYLWVAGRQTTGTPDNYYSLQYSASVTLWEIWKSAGAGPTFTSLGSFTQALSLNTTYVGKLEMIGTAIKGYVDTVQRISVVDSAVTAAGRAGLGGFGQTTVGSAINMDNFLASDVVTASDIPVPLWGIRPNTLVRM